MTEEQKANETIEQKTNRVAGARVSKVLDTLDLLAGMVNGDWDFGKEDVADSIKAMRNKLSSVEMTFGRHFAGETPVKEPSYRFGQGGVTDATDDGEPQVDPPAYDDTEPDEEHPND